MAVTSLWPIKGRVDKVITYVRNPEKITEEYYSENAALHVIDGVVQYAADDTKTERREYVTCLNCDEATATEEFILAKKMFRKEDGRLCYHGYQSFKPGEVNAQTAHEIGVALAQRLWGNRFQVVIATHCNTGAYHNHFVLNSVSFRDGLKFYNRRSDYLAMRAASDELCRNYGISVIENPQQHKKNYGLRKAEQQGQLTQSQIIRNDIDRAVRASLVPQQFAAAMREMGYTIRVKGESGVRLKHPTVTPPGAKKNFRFDSLGEGYDLESILDRVNMNWHTERLYEAPKSVFRTYKMVRKPMKKLTGLRALYFRYCILLGTIKKKPERVKKVSWLLREDLIKLDRYIAQAKLLIDNKIETAEDLDAYKSSVEGRLAALEAERTACRNHLRRTTGRENGPSDDELKAKIKHLSGEMKQVRKELEYCSEIAEKSSQVRQNLVEQQRNNQTPVQEHRSQNRDLRER
ncbi:MAG: relaxase/mobilization nuclease domain-containing protein [Oscillospiraceae bacterium]|nr:relaxase/mobilization nuclease domain-containing protein [Oscillospiraceae bacterium]